MDRLKILFIAGWYPMPESPTNGIFVQEHARAVSLYNDVVVIHSPQNGSSAGRANEISDQIEEGIRTIRTKAWLSPIPKTSIFLHLWRTYAAFRKLLKEGWKPNIIHAHVYHTGVAGVVLGRIYKTPVIITEHYSGFPQHLLSRSSILKAKFAMNMANLVLPVSDNLRKHIQSYGVHNRFQIVPNAVNTKLYYHKPSSRESDIKRMLLVSLLHPKKGVTYLLQALRQLGEKRYDFALDIVGDGPYRDEYEEQARESDIADKVRFHGLKPKEEVAEFMRKCDFFVLPSLSETFGVVLIEALASGKPVIATNMGGPNEIVNKEVGLLVPPKDVDALAEAIDYMLDRYQDYSAKKIRAYAKEKFSYEAVGKTLDLIYRDIATCKR